MCDGLLMLLLLLLQVWACAERQTPAEEQQG